MATPRDGVIPLSGFDVVNVITSGYFWQLGPDRTLRWALADGFNEKSWAGADIMQQNISAMLDSFANYIDVKFEYTGYFTDPSAAHTAGSDITISLDDGGGLFESVPTAWGLGFFPNSSFNSLYTGAPGDIFINTDTDAINLTFAPGSAGWHLLIHEIGHALGLKHTHDDGGTGRPTALEVDLERLDIDWASMMSYRDEFNDNLLSWDPATPMLMDVIGLQYLYGANLNTNSGNSTLVIEDTNDYRTLFDAGGAADRVDASSMEEGVEINLLLASQLGSVTKIADADRSSPTLLYWLRGDIEDATGSEFSDEITGNGANNSFLGRRGDDSMDGGAGTDSAQYIETTVSQADITVEGDSFQIKSAEGTDSLFNMERLIFTDGNIALDINGVGGKAYRIYQAAFDRTPDENGVGYWIAQMDQGMEVTEVANRFIDSDEFKSLYGENPSNEQFLTALYSNVLDREPDNEGFVWWLDQLENNPEKTPNRVLADFSESPENQNNVIDIIGNGFAYTFWDPASL